MQPQSLEFISVTEIAGIIFGILSDGRVSFNWNKHVYILNEFAFRIKANVSAML